MYNVCIGMRSVNIFDRLNVYEEGQNYILFCFVSAMRMRSSKVVLGVSFLATPLDSPSKNNPLALFLVRYPASPYPIQI